MQTIQWITSVQNFMSYFSIILEKLGATFWRARYITVGDRYNHAHPIAVSSK